MQRLISNQKIPSKRVWGFLFFFALITSLASCNKASDTKVVQKTFASPAEAGAAVLDAAKSGDQAAWLATFGPESKDVLFSGDAVKDKDTAQDFVAAYNQMNRWVKLKIGGQMLYVGADNYPFPIPLKQNSSGQWYFDTAAGEDEIIARRVGNGELTAIAACDAIADAQQQYFSQTHDGDTAHQFAQKFVADEGKQNGLYWHVPEGQTRAHSASLVILPRPQGTPIPATNLSRSTVTISEFSPNKETKLQEVRRSSSKTEK